MVIENKTARLMMAALLFVILVLTLAFILPRLSKHYPELVPEKKISTQQNNSEESLPLATLYGKIGKIEENNFHLLLDDPITKEHKDYLVKISPSTKLLQRNIFVPYLLTPTPSELNTEAEYSDLFEGMSVELKTRSDIAQNEITADIVLLPRPPYVLHGTIKTIEKTAIVVDAAPVFETFIVVNSAPTLPEHKIYTINILENTEISSQTENGVKRHTLKDLLQGQMVVIYAASDVTKSAQITAARIEPIL